MRFLLLLLCLVKRSRFHVIYLLFVSCKACVRLTTVASRQIISQVVLFSSHAYA
jgi:hypothetical protein